MSLRLIVKQVVRTALVCCALVCGLAPGARADYVVLRSGARLNVTGYEILADRYRLHLKGGVAEVPFDDIVGIEPEEIFEPNPEPVVLNERTPFEKAIRAAAARYSLDADLIHCVIAVESNFDPKAVSPKNARGLMQLLPQTAALFGVKNIFDPEENINAGSHYLHDLLARYNNNITLALAAYNAGPERVDQYGHRVPPYLETMKYVQRIAKTYAKLKAAAAPAKTSESTKVSNPLSR